MTTRIEQITDALHNCARVANGIEQRLLAHFGLHAAACLNRDQQEIAQRRDELHTILDSLLDNKEELQRLIDELTTLSRSKS